MIFKIKPQTLPPEIGNLAALVELNLCYNQLTTLPPEIGNLTSLKGLYLVANNLTALPPEIGNLRALKSLGLSGNNLTALPPEIGNLVALKSLGLCGNNLTALPLEIGNLMALEDLDLESNKLVTLLPEIGNLTSLKELYLPGNKLTALPPEIGNLAALHTLRIYDNPDLRSLPMTLGNCQEITDIDLEGCAEGTPEEMDSITRERDAILVRTEAQRRAEGVLSLQARLATWKAYGTFGSDLGFLSNIENFTTQQQGDISEWLLRLERCQDFKYKRGELATLVCNMLMTLKDSKDFRDAFFSKVEGNLECCDDRASMLLNIIYTDWKLCTLPPNAPDKGKIEFLVSLAKTLTFREKLENMIDKYERETGRIHRESVEIFLHYEIEHKKRLGLLTAIDNMHYSQMGNAPNVVDEKILLETVNEKYMDTLADLGALHKILEKYSKYTDQETVIRGSSR